MKQTLQTLIIFLALGLSCFAEEKKSFEAMSDSEKINTLLQRVEALEKENEEIKEQVEEIAYKAIVEAERKRAREVYVEFALPFYKEFFKGGEIPLPKVEEINSLGDVYKPMNELLLMLTQ